MAITVFCPNQHKLTAKDHLAGKRLRCPKCQAEVRVPAAQVEAPVQPLDDAPNHPDTADPLFHLPAADSHVPDGFASLGDPLALGDLGSLGNVSAFEPTATQTFPQSRPIPVAPIKAEPHSKPVKSPEPARFRLKDISAVGWGAAGGGALIGLLLVLVPGLILLSNRRPEGAVAQNQPTAATEMTAVVLPKLAESSPSAPAAEPATLASVPPRTPEPPTPETSQPGPSKPEPSKPAAPTAKTPFGMARFDLDKRLEGFKLPATTFASAYDEKTGRLAITNDQAGILFYNLDKLLAGDLDPERTISTTGVPAALCLKVLSDRRVFVFASKDEPAINVLDADSLEPVDKIPLKNLIVVDFLTGSQNPDDPFVYYSTQRHSTNANDRTTQRNSTDASDRTIYLNSDRIGRVNLVTKQQEGHTDKRFSDLALSSDGSCLYLRPMDNTGIAGTWSDFVEPTGGFVIQEIGTWERDALYGPACPLGEVVAVQNHVFTPGFGLQVARLDYSPMAVFQNPPAFFGLAADGVVFASTNDYRRFDAVPLPLEWQSERQPRLDDFRSRPQVAPGFPSAYLHVAADNARKIGLALFSDYLVIAPLDRVKVPSEPSLIVRSKLPKKVKVGETVEAQLESSAEDTQFEFVPTDEGLPRSRQRQVALLGTSPAIDSSKVELALGAAVSNQQSQIFVNDVSKCSGMKLPATLQLGDELMKVTAVDTFRGMLTVQRTEPAVHTVSSRVFILKDDPGITPPKPSLPTVAEKTLHWTPSDDQMGRQVIRMRSRSGERVHDWYWEVKVERPAIEFPFYVVGIKPDLSGTLAVVWGSESRPQVSIDPSVHNQPPPVSNCVGVFDLTEKRLLRHLKTHYSIAGAALHESGVYLSLIGSKAQIINLRDPVQPKQGKIVRLDSETLETIKEVESTDASSSIEIIAGRYLTTSPHVRFTIPNLEAVEPALTEHYPYPIAGRVNQGWVWDGVLWDEPMKTPQLLLFPVHFEQQGRYRKSRLAAALGGSVHMRTFGSHVGTWCPNSMTMHGQHSLKNLPVTLDFNTGVLSATSWADTSIVPIRNEAPAVASVQIFNAADELRLLPPVLGRDQRKREQMLQGSLADANGQVYVATLGRVYAVPLDRLVREEQPFRFIERQDKILVQANKPLKLKYSAPGAAQYHFQMWYDHPLSFDEPPAIAATSKNGEFEINIAADQLAGQGIDLNNRPPASIEPPATWGPPQPGNIDPKKRKASLDVYKQMVRRLTGENPNGLVFPVYVSVTAEHEDGRQKAGLAHSYLVELPAPKPQAPSNR